MTEKFVVAKCSGCDNSQLEIHVTKDSLRARCSLCDIQVFEVKNLEAFLNEVVATKCSCCKKRVFDTDLSN